MLDNGYYNFKIIESNIKVNKQNKKYIQLKLRVQDGDFEGEVLYHHFIPWNAFNWMHNIKAIFTEHDIQTYMLEYQDEDTVWVVSQLALGELVRGKVRQEPATTYVAVSYNSVYLSSKAIDDRLRA